MKRSLASVKRTAPIFAALGDPQRLAFVIRLGREGPLPTLTLQQATPLTRQAVTKHLQQLEHAGLVHSERAGRERVWKLQQQRLAEVREQLAEISAQWDATLGRFKAFVEDG